MPFNLDTYHFFMLEIFKIQRAVLKYLIKACQPQLSPRAIKIRSYSSYPTATLYQGASSCWLLSLCLNQALLMHLPASYQHIELSVRCKEGNFGSWV